MKKFAYDFEKELVALEEKIAELETLEKLTPEQERILAELKSIYPKVFAETYSNLTPWQKVQLARHPNRPTAIFYVKRLFSNFESLNRPYDPALACGLAEFNGIRVAIAFVEKGSNLRERQLHRFGMPGPEGYERFCQLIEVAESLRIPIITLVDTPGAYPGVEAEEKGQAAAIAKSIERMLFATVPTVAVIIGEGGSGGAIALSAADRIYIMENAYYSVISPEGCASILFRDEKMAPVAASLLKLTAQDLLSFGLVHGIIPEPLGSAARDPEKAADLLGEVLQKSLAELLTVDTDTLLKARNKFFLEMRF
jgi:acetyl-CoA carboxylase carboxyl transferase subunit alpha